MSYSWNWQSFDSVGADGVSTYAQGLLSGAIWTVATAGAAAAIALALGVSIGLLRVSASRLARALGAGYVEVFRDVPLLVQMFVWFFVVPEFLPHVVGQWLKALEYGPYFTASLSLGLYAAARVGEQTRAAVEALPQGQLMAALALGLSRASAFRYVVLPQAMRLVIAPLTSELVNIVKNTSIGMTIGLMELTARAREMQEATFHTFEAFAAATLAYLLINALVIGSMRVCEARLHRLSIAVKPIVEPKQVFQ